MSEEGEGRKAALVRFKIITALLVLLSVTLLICAGLGIEYYHTGLTGPPYYIGGFIAGVPALVAVILSMSVLASAVGKDANDAKMKELAPFISCQYSWSTLLIPACFIGSIMTGIGGFAGADEDIPKGTSKFLATVILVGCILTFCVTIASMCTVSTYGKYFGVIINKRGRRTIVITDTGDGAGANRETGGVSVHTNMNVFTTGANNQQVNQLEQQNRLLQQQLLLQQQILNQQQQQQQNQFSGGMYPPPPPPLYTDQDPAYPPSAPPPPYSKPL